MKLKTVPFRGTVFLNVKSISRILYPDGSQENGRNRDDSHLSSLDVTIEIKRSLPNEVGTRTLHPVRI